MLSARIKRLKCYLVISLSSILTSYFIYTTTMSLPAPEEEEEDYFLPLEDQRVFGAGIRRKRVPFVRSTEHELNTTTTIPLSPSSTTPSGPSIADKYLSIVLKRPPSTTTSPSTPTPRDSPPRSRTQSAPPSTEAISPPPPATEAATGGAGVRRCEVCNLPLQPTIPTAPSTNSNTAQHPHEATLAHQLCLKHSHPPSNLDRSRTGLRYLSYYGWDPDTRLGLGAPGREGIREPLKGRVKNDTVGLGVGRDVDGDRIPLPQPQQEKKKVQKLNARQVRKGAVEDRRRGERLREMFFQRDDVLMHLGKG